MEPVLPRFGCSFAIAPGLPWLIAYLWLCRNVLGRSTVNMRSRTKDRASSPNVIYHSRIENELQAAGVKTIHNYWVAVRELNLSYHNPETILFGVWYIHIHIMVN